MTRDYILSFGYAIYVLDEKQQDSEGRQNGYQDLEWDFPGRKIK